LAAQTQDAIMQARAAGAKEGYVKAQEYERCVGYARLVTAQRVEAQLAELGLWARIKAAKPWKAVGQTWEEWAEPNLGCSYKTIDRAIEARITIGEPTLKLLMEFDITKTQVRALCRAVRQEGLQIEGTVIRDGEIVINIATEPARALDYLERRDVADRARQEELRILKEESKAKDTRLAEHQEMARKEATLRHELLDAKQAQIRALSQLHPPADLAADADRKSWRAARQALGECDLHVAALAALAADPQRTDVLRARVVGHLRMLQGWIQAAVDEIAEQMPPEWAPTIEAEEAECAVAPALPQEIVEEIRQRTRAKGGLTLVPSAGRDHEPSRDTLTGTTH